MQFFLPYPSWFLLLCLLAGALFAAGLYFHERQLESGTASDRMVKSLLAAARFAVVSLIAFLLLSPYVKTVRNEQESPFILFVQDNSQSAFLNMTPADSAAWVDGFSRLQESAAGLGSFRAFHFSGTLEEGFRIDHSGQATDLSAVFEGLFNRFGNQNAGAIILATDGLYNQGMNPLYSPHLMDVPVYILAMGDTTPKRDLKVTEVKANKIVYLGDLFTVGVLTEAMHCRNETTTVSLYETGPNGRRLLASKPYTPAGDPERNSFTFTLDASAPGLHHYQAFIAPVEGEVSQNNNTYDFYVEVLDSREKVLILAAAPHPDIAALRHALEQNKNYEVSIQYIQDFRATLKEYDLVILHQVPAGGFNRPELLQSLRDKSIPAWYILGGQSSVPAFNQVQTALSITGNRNNHNEVTASLAPGFTSFTMPDNPGMLVNMPPLFAPFGKYKPSPGADVLLNQKIGSVATDYPLWLVFSGPSGRAAVLAGTGLWRWRLYEWNRQRSTRTIDALINKTVQFLSVRADKRPFRLEPVQRVFNEGETVKLNAYLYNRNYEAVNDPEVQVSVFDTSNREYRFTMNRTGNFYTLDAGGLPAGEYRAEATTRWNGQPYRAVTAFSINRLNLEMQQTTANHRLLYQLARQTGGHLFYPGEWEKLIQTLQEDKHLKPILRETEKTRPLVSLKWLLFLIAGLLSMEWFVRKWRGAY